MSIPTPVPSRIGTPTSSSITGRRLLRLGCAVHSVGLTGVVRLQSARGDDRGQSTAEYALVILGAAAVALVLIAWASQTDKIGQLLDSVIDSIISRFR